MSSFNVTEKNLDTFSVLLLIIQSEVSYEISQTIKKGTNEDTKRDFRLMSHVPQG